jgi:hypothetical protein
LPDGVLSGTASAQGGGAGAQAAGVLTAAERAALLDEQLRRGYEKFDGFILGERERAQAESNAAGSSSPAGGASGAGGGAGDGQPQTLEQSATQFEIPGALPPSSSTAGSTQSFPPPEDIPSGRDDDVVARQLREAAMAEPDPELREALWDEYRNYTGLSEQ